MRASACSTPQSQTGAGQGKGQPGDVLQPGREEGDSQGRAGGTGSGEIKFVVELKIDEIVDWLWDELKLPELKPKRATTLDDPHYVREGWDKRGARSRLDRRRTMKEAVKRHAIQETRRRCADAHQRRPALSPARASAPRPPPTPR